jgi:hypothetical protein
MIHDKVENTTLHVDISVRFFLSKILSITAIPLFCFVNGAALSLLF